MGNITAALNSNCWSVPCVRCPFDPWPEHWPLTLDHSSLFCSSFSTLPHFYSNFSNCWTSWRGIIKLFVECFCLIMGNITAALNSNCWSVPCVRCPFDPWPEHWPLTLDHSSLFCSSFSTLPHFYSNFSNCWTSWRGNSKLI